MIGKYTLTFGIAYKTLNMKNIILILSVFILFTNCKDEKNKTVQKDTKETSNTNDNLCNNEVAYGDVTFCLPQLNGITEAYKDPIILRRVNRFEDKSNIILGYYISEEVYAMKDSIEHVDFDNYYKVYAPKQGVNLNTNTSQMKEIMNMMTSGFIDKTLEKSNEDFKTSGIEMSQPTLIEKYQLNRESSTMVILMRIRNQNTDKLVAITMTAILMKQRIVFVAHYLDYKDDKTIKLVKEHTDTFINELLLVNNAN